jgi:hypothetical protein
MLLAFTRPPAKHTHLKTHTLAHTLLHASVATGRASSVTYSNFPLGRPVQIFPAAVRAGVNDALSNDALRNDNSTTNKQSWSSAEILTGLNAFLNNTFGPNLIAYTSGGGIENIGVTRAVNEMLVQAPYSVGSALFHGCTPTCPPPMM